MNLTPQEKESLLRDAPIAQSRFYISEDGKYFVHKMTYTTIKPIAQIQDMVRSNADE